MKKYPLILLALIILSYSSFVVTNSTLGQNINPLDQFTSTTTPTSAITQRTYGKSLKITGLVAGNLCVDSNGLVYSSGCAGGSGSSDGYGFTTSSYGGVTVQSTTSPLWLKGTNPYSLLASTTLFTYSSTTYASFTTASSTTGLFGTIIVGTTTAPSISSITSYNPSTSTIITLIGALNVNNVGAGIRFFESNNETAPPGFDNFYDGGTNLYKIRSYSNSPTPVDRLTIARDTGLVTISYASTTGITASYASSTDLRGGTVTIGALSGVLKATAGLVSTASNGTDYTLISGTTCGGTDKVSAISASGSVTCSADQTGAGSSAFEVATTTGLSVSQLSYFTQTSGRTTLGGVSTSSLAVGSSISSSGTLGSQIGGSNTTLSLNMANANSWTALQTFTYSSTTGASFSYASSTTGVFGTVGIGSTSPTSSLVVSGSGIFSDGQFPETSTQVGIFIGRPSGASGGQSGRVLFTTGTASDNWQIDNDTGTFRWYKPGVVHMTLNATNGLALPNGTSGILKASGTGNSYFTGNLGIGTTSPYAKLSVVGEVVGANFTATTTAINTFPYASTTAISAVYASSTRGDFGTLNLPNLSQGLLYVGSGNAVNSVATSTLSAGAGLSGSFTQIGSGGSISLNTANANTWSALQTFNYSSSTYSSFISASTTNLTVGNITFSTTTAGCVKTTSTGIGYIESCGGSATAGGSNTQLQFNDSTSLAGASKLTWDKNTNRLMLGNGTADSLLTIASTTGSFPAPLSNTDVHMIGLDANPFRMSLDSFSSTNTFGSQIQGRRARNTSASPSAVSADDTLLSLGADGYGATGFHTASIANIAFRAEAGFTDTSAPSYINFFTTPANSVTAIERMRISSKGYVGIGTTTPWGMLSLASTTFGYTDPLIAISTSTDSYGDVFFANATTSNLISNAPAGTNRQSQKGVRIGIGLWNYEGYGGLLDNLVVQGTFNTSGFMHSFCDAPVGSVPLGADLALGCGGFTYQADASASLTATSLGGGGQNFARLGFSNGTNNNAGGGVFANGASAGWLTLASSTPQLEVSARVINSTATTTQFFIGFTNITTGGSTFETAPTAGCWFTASSTQANWWAECRTASGSNTTLVNTGVASSTVIGGNGGFRKFRIQADSTKASFFIQSTEGSALTKVAEISTTYPSSTLLNAGVHAGIISQNTSSFFDFYRLRFWWRDNLPAL